MNVSGVDAQGDPCTATISWSIAHSSYFPFASSPSSTTKYTLFHNKSLSYCFLFYEMFIWATMSYFSSILTLTLGMWVCIGFGVVECRVAVRQVFFCYNLT
jgi:hypothetical protein